MQPMLNMHCSWHGLHKVASPLHPLTDIVLPLVSAGFYLLFIGPESLHVIVDKPGTVK